MLVGTASLEALARDAATISAYREEAVLLENVECLQLTAELRRSAGAAILPPALHPTSPASLSLQLWNVGSSPWGAFSMALTRASCRSGVRARGFTTACFASTPTAVEGLRATFGFPARLARIHLRRNYDDTVGRVCEADREILAVRGLDPEPLDPGDVQYTGTMNLAHTPNGLRLVQVEAEHGVTRVERLHGEIASFAGEAWGSALLDPYFVVAASIAVGSVTFPPLRFVCRPDELAFTGTEAVR
jgi:hypothetical protein